MKRVAAAIVLFLWSGLAIAGWLPLAYAPAQQAAFFASAGSDANPCSQASPCLTITRANAIRHLGGSTINFNGGDTFSGSIVLTTTNAPGGNVTIQSYGTGQATISSGNSAECIKWTNVPAVIINPITCVGGGTTTNTTAGISGVNSQAGNTKLAGPTITGVTVSGYGYNGISIQGTNGTSGFSGVSITNNTVHDCTGNSTNSLGTAGIFVFSGTGYGLGASTPSHNNVTISGNTVFNITGTAGSLTNWTGSGIVVSQTQNALVTLNVAHDFGASSDFTTSGPVGIWAADADTITISFNEAYNGKHAVGGIDGGGFDFDGGVINSLMEYNKSHDNIGFGYLADNYQDATNLPWGNNTYRFNLGQNNSGGEFAFVFARAASGAIFVYNNTFSNQILGVGTVFVGSSGSTTVTGTVANNIITGSANGGTLISIPHPSSLTFAGNDYFTYANAGISGNTASISWNGTTYSGTGAGGMATAFAAWQTATGQEKIAGVNVGQTVNPNIYVPGGLFTTGGYVPTKDMANNLQAGSAMIGAGLNLTTQFGINPGAVDYYGAAVSAASLPIGAAAGDFTTFTASSTLASNFLARTSGFAKLDNVNYNSLLSSGYFNNFDLLYVMAAPNSAASLLNLMAATFPLTNNGGTFAANLGYTGNGTSAFVDTGWKASSNGVNYTLASATHFGYALTDGAADGKSIYGAQNVAVTSEATSYPGTGGWYFDVNDFTGVTRTGITTSKGMFLADRASGNLTGWANGGIGTPTARATVALPDKNMLILQTNGDAGSFSSNTVAAAGFGAGAQNDQAISMQVNAFMMAKANNVY